MSNILKVVLLCLSLMLVRGGNVRAATDGDTDKLGKLAELMEQRLKADLQTHFDGLFAKLVDEVEGLKEEVLALQHAAEKDRHLQVADSLGTRVSNIEDRIKCIKKTSDAGDLIFEGCNVHVRNNKGTTRSSDGKGNLIVGWNEDGDCPQSCKRDGSHYIIVGPDHEWQSYGGLAVGRQHLLTDSWCSVAGGIRNSARAMGASVSGGLNNDALAQYSSILGGRRNIVFSNGQAGTIAGGVDNRVTQDYGHVSGGHDNAAKGVASSILGGNEETVTRKYEMFPKDDGRDYWRRDDWSRDDKD